MTGRPHEPQPTGGQPGFARRVLLAASLAAGMFLLLIALWFAAHALLVAFAGVLVAIVLRAPADWLAERSRLSERWSLAVVLAILAAALAGLGLLIAPQVSEQVQQLSEQLPQSLQQFRQWLQEREWGRWLLTVVPSPELMQTGGAGGLLSRAGGMAYSAVQTFFELLVLLFVSLYLAIDPRLYTEGLLRLFPPRQRGRAAEVLAATGRTLRWWLVGTLVRMAAVGAMTFVGLWLLGVPLAFTLALLALLLDFVPYFGPILAAVPAVLLAFTDGPQQALYVAALYIAVQQIEGLLITPLLYQRTVHLPPVVTILAQVVLFAMFGNLGILLATPLAAVGLVWVKMLYVEQALGDRLETPDDADP
ncbi:MAG TPA: AI-2E family transporter [Planctomycetaceae bacterium]|nr:AI-2E family transporter [Planctomycetaceae bacterium]